MSADTAIDQPEPSACALDLTKPFLLGDWHIDPTSRTASQGDAVVKIDPRNMRVLQILVERHGQVVSQRELEALAWEGVVVTPDSLYQAIRQLRQALRDTKSPAKYIETVPRRGYRVVAQPGGSHRTGNPPSSMVQRDEKRSSSSLPSRTIRRTAFVSALLVGLIVASFVFSGVIQKPELITRTPPQSDSQLRARQDGRVYRASVKTLRSLGHDALRAGKPQEAIEFFEQALQRQISDAGDNNELAMEALVDMALGHMWLDEDSKAYDFAVRAMSIADRLGPSSNPERVASVRILTDTLIALGNYSKAEALITDVVRTSRIQFGSDHAILSPPLSSLAQLRYAQGRLPEAEQLAREVVAIESRARGPQSVATANARNLLGAILVDRGRFEDAEREARAVIETASRNAVDGPHPLEVSAKHFLGEALMGQGEYARAEVILKEELSALNQARATEWRIARAASALGEVYSRKGNLPESERYLALAKNKLKRTKGWPMEREVRNLARRLEELDASRPGQVSALAN